MSGVVPVGLDPAKDVFRLHGADASGRAVLRRRVRRGQVLEVLARFARRTVAMGACGGAQFWGREIGKLGHEVRPIPPAYVKPIVRRQKSDGEEERGPSGAA